MSAKLIKRACLVLKPHPGGKAVKCVGVFQEDGSIRRCLPAECVWARWHKLPADSPLRRNRVLTAKLAQR